MLLRISADEEFYAQIINALCSAFLHLRGEVCPFLGEDLAKSELQSVIHLLVCCLVCGDAVISGELALKYFFYGLTFGNALIVHCDCVSFLT